MDKYKVVLEGFGAEYDGKTKTVDFLRESKTMVVVKWGNGEKRFNKKNRYSIGGDIWSGWRLKENWRLV